MRDRMKKLLCCLLCALLLLGAAPMMTEPARAAGPGRERRRRQPDTAAVGPGQSGADLRRPVAGLSGKAPAQSAGGEPGKRAAYLAVRATEMRCLRIQSEGRPGRLTQIPPLQWAL